MDDDDSADIKWSALDLKLLAQSALLESPPLILDLSEAENPKEKVGTLLSAIYEKISNRRTPYLVVLERQTGSLLRAVRGSYL